MDSLAGVTLPPVRIDSTVPVLYFYPLRKTDLVIEARVYRRPGVGEGGKNEERWHDGHECSKSKMLIWKVT